MRNKKFIALDLEMNTAEGSCETGKIIEVGISIGSVEDFVSCTPDSRYLKKNWYINPFENIHPRITELTGITNDDVNYNSSNFETIHNEIKELCEEHDVFKLPIVWGNGDLTLMRKEFEKSLGKFEIFSYRDIDVKTIHTFNCIVKGKISNTSLISACRYYKMNFTGVPHRAADDAYNTLNIFLHLIDKNSKIYDTMNQIKKIGD